MWIDKARRNFLRLARMWCVRLEKLTFEQEFVSSVLMDTKPDQNQLMTDDFFGKAEKRRADDKIWRRCYYWEQLSIFFPNPCLQLLRNVLWGTTRN